MQQAYPARASELGSGGRVIVSCIARADGRLEGCTVASETPEDLGFGAAALALMPSFRARPTTSTGGSVAGMALRIPISFRLPDTLEPLEVAAMCYGFAAQAMSLNSRDAIARNAVIYWSNVHASMLMRTGQPPSAVERAQAAARTADLSAGTFQRYRIACFSHPPADFPYGGLGQ